MHVDFYADGVSSMTPDREILSGRPFGGLGIMWRKAVALLLKSMMITD